MVFVKTHQHIKVTCPRCDVPRNCLQNCLHRNSLVPPPRVVWVFFFSLSIVVRKQHQLIWVASCFCQGKHAAVIKYLCCEMFIAFPSLFIKRNVLQGFPGWLSGKESSCQCRRHRFDPWSGKISHAAKQLSLCAPTPEPMCYNDWRLGALEPVLLSKRSHCSETPTQCS